jgi:hypothetical protein
MYQRKKKINISLTFWTAGWPLVAQALKSELVLLEKKEKGGEGGSGRMMSE